MKRHHHLLLGLAIACGGSGGQLEPRFVAVHNTMSAMGLAQTGPISEGSLPEGGEVRLDVRLEPGRCTTFLALGSSSVRDLDIRVVGEGDREIGRDVTHDRQAAAQVCPDRAGDYQVIVTMREGRGSYLVSSWSGAPVVMHGGVARAGEVGPGTCDDPIPLPLGRPVTGDTTGARNVTQGPCAQGNAPERVYRLEVEQRAQVSLQLQSAYDGALYILRACGQIGTMIACNDDHGDTSHSRIDATLEPGTYFVVVDGYGEASGAYELLATATPLRSVAEVCADAPALVAGRAQNGSTEGQADYFQATCAGGAAAPDQVFRLDVPQRARLRVRQSSDHDGALYVRSTCDDATTEIACNDDFIDTRRSLVTAVVDPGRYFVYADGYSGPGQPIGQGTFSLTAELASPAGGSATGDSCGAAAPIPTGTFTIDTFEASDATRGSCGGAGAPDVIYALDVRARSRLDATVRGAEFEGAMYVQRTCGDASSEVACTAIASSDPRLASSTLTTMLAPGRYSLVFDGARPDTFGSAEVEVRLTDLAALERVCQRAPLLQPGRTVNGNTTNGTDDFQASCAGGAASNDVVYRLRVPRRSVVRVDLSSDYDGALHLRRDCTDPATEIACNDDHEDNRHSRIETTLDAGTYYVVVDGFRTGSVGAYSLQVQLSNP
ncbi:MAG: hypothetical protein KF901_16265 [Myxococcales bacterium]|nr:hypothetical protein [Myxococcales bacterium]